MIKTIFTQNAPQPVGPYSQAIQADQLLFLAGQIPLDPVSGELISGGVQDQTRRVIENIKAVLEAAGGELSKVVKATVFLKDLKFFDDMNKIFTEYFEKVKPARSTLQVARLPKDADVEIEVIAVI
ncbi:MAG: RidA family protein [Chlamydiae bacterium]|nr:RidA family protein [Chlamydiota bacterium]MBI3277045.1 RidA family protein [Chlamydiota bacterium]